MGFLKPLFKQLKRRQVVPEMRAGLWIMVEAMLERNYLYAYDIYMRLAIGEFLFWVSRLTSDWSTISQGQHQLHQVPAESVML